ncbi:hypothetical protein CFC21_020930 [Triticum aestivum]|uniref:Exocyst subunit Exo70 family protein n=2 Tax=Triticum aestivum TaxID=4565 RepID=A0A9R1J6I1_WHEAT|nr:uncharacterized protein LOC123040081 [Triticum aestivum]KAF7005829.1 hypothetical protein CFC21_020930 [Triticum aestivum]
MDMFRGSLDAAAAAAATIGRSDKVAGILNKRLDDDLGEIVLEIHSSDESTVHPANVVLIQALAISRASNTIYPYSDLVDWWVSRLEKDAELVRQGEQGGKYIFLLNNTFDVLQMVRRQRASSASDQLASRLGSVIEGYKRSYLDECWAPLNRLNLEEFTAQFLATCECQMTWKVTAELRYQLRREIVDLIVPSYEVSLSALRGLNGPMVGNKKQKKYTGEQLEEEIRGLFEG